MICQRFEAKISRKVKFSKIEYKLVLRNVLNVVNIEDAEARRELYRNKKFQTKFEVEKNAFVVKL